MKASWSTLRDGRAGACPRGRPAGPRAVKHCDYGQRRPLNDRCLLFGKAAQGSSTFLPLSRRRPGRDETWEAASGGRPFRPCQWHQAHFCSFCGCHDCARLADRGCRCCDSPRALRRSVTEFVVPPVRCQVHDLRPEFDCCTLVDHESAGIDLRT